MERMNLKRLYLAIPLLCVPLLQGCIPLAIGAAAGTALVAYKKPRIDVLADDATIYQKIDKKFAEDPGLNRDNHIVISVTNHNVLLVGQVPSQEIKIRAEQTVRTVRHVKHIYNYLIVGPETTGILRSNDSWITTKVKTEFIGTKNLMSVRIKVVTENSVVYLLGITSRAQGQLAANVARRVTGVQKVVKLFEYQE